MLPRAPESSTARAAAGACLLVAALGIGALAWGAARTERGGTRWRGYRVLLVDASLPEAEVLAGLGGAGVKAAVSESTEPVLVSDWSGLETRTLAEAETSLVAGDPRLDGYMQRLPLWFRASVGGLPYRAIYVKSDSPFDSGAAIARGLERYRGRFVLPDLAGPARSGEVDSLFLACSLVFLLISCVALPLAGRAPAPFRGLSLRRPGALALDRVAFRLSLILPWAALAGRGPSAAAIATLWGLAIADTADHLEIPLEEFRRGRGAGKLLESLALRGLPSPILPVIACLALIAAPALAPAAGIALLGSLVALPGYALASARLSLGGRFIPLPIGGRRRGLGRAASVSGRIRAALACASILVWGLFRVLAPSTAPVPSAGMAFPSPFAARGSLRPLISEARGETASESGDVLPGLASYLEHRAIQEALPFIRVGESRPDPFAEARLPMPSEGPGEKKAGSRQGIAFTDDWARAAYREVPSLSIEGMLLSQGAATLGRDGPGEGRSGRPLAPILVLLYIFLLIPLSGRILAGVPFARDAASGELRQEA
jgi:hypothetical protein